MPRMRALPFPRFVVPESVDIGDTIRVTWKVGDVEHTRMGKVGAIHRNNRDRSRVFVTEAGNDICHWHPDNKVRFTLLAEAPVKETPLFEMENAQ